MMSEMHKEVHEHHGHEHHEIGQCGHEHEHHEYGQCGHEHSHHEHSQYDSGCGCSACTGQAGAGKMLEVSSHMQDRAVVVSATYRVTADAGRMNRLLTEHMEALADRIDSMGGIIGHIKASAEIRHVEMYSLTDRVVMKKEAELPDITLHMAAIVFVVEEEEMLRIIREMFEDMEKNKEKISAC